MELALNGKRNALLFAAETAAAGTTGGGGGDAVVRHKGQPLHGSKSGDWLGWGAAGGDDGPDEQSVDDGLALCLTSGPLPAGDGLVGQHRDSQYHVVLPPKEHSLHCLSCVPCVSLPFRAVPRPSLL
eukprot:SAG22_NODE_261_length_13373_cov_17.745472_9_plen_127_part_00